MGTNDLIVRKASTLVQRDQMVEISHWPSRVPSAISMLVWKTLEASYRYTWIAFMTCHPGSGRSSHDKPNYELKSTTTGS